MPSPTVFCAECARLLRAAVVLVDALDDADFGRVGSQLRHIAEFFQIFLDGIHSGRIDYDARERKREVERDRVAARSLLRALEARFAAFEADPSGTLLVRMDDAGGNWLSSSAERELRFLSSHAVHHFAIIRLLLAERGPTLVGDLAVAAATLAQRSAR